MEQKETEKRRKDLLEQTRSLYTDKNPVPAVHPRYRNAYNSLYRQEEDPDTGSFGLRTLICCLLFLGFILMDEYNVSAAHVSSSLITETIQDGVDVQAVWNEIKSVSDSGI